LLLGDGRYVAPLSNASIGRRSKLNNRPLATPEAVVLNQAARRRLEVQPRQGRAASLLSEWADSSSWALFS